MADTQTFQDSIAFAQRQQNDRIEEIIKWAKELENSHKEGYKGEIIDHEIRCIRDALKGLEWSRQHEENNKEYIRQLENRN